MTSSLRWKKLAFLLWISIASAFCIPAYAQKLAAWHDNQNKFYIFDNGKSMEAEYLPVNDFKIGGKCILYTDNRNRLKMYYNGSITTLEAMAPDKMEALDDLAVYSIGGVVKIIDNGKTFTISTYSVDYLAEDSLVVFYDMSRQLLATYYNGRIRMLEDGLAGTRQNQFKAGDNMVVWVSTKTKDLKVFYRGEIGVIEPFLSGGDFRTGRDIVAYVNDADNRFKIYYQGEITEAEEFPPQSYVTGDGIVAYVDYNGSFRLFDHGTISDIASYKPDFYAVRNNMVIYGDRGYFKVWYNGRDYTLENYIPDNWEAEWNTIVYRDVNRNVKTFVRGDLKVLTYDTAEDIFLYRDLIVVNKGMNNHNVYFEGKKY